MIPKIIHYVWFSVPVAEDVGVRIGRWQEKCSGYEIKHWGLDDIQDIDSRFLHETIEAKKWAFATDYLRLYVLYHFGGIYLDSDVELVRGFDEFLNHPCFIGKEQSIHIEGRMQEQYLTAHCIGAQKGNSFIKRCLEYYDEITFRLSNDNSLPMSLKYNVTLLPHVMSEIAKEMEYDPKPLTQSVQNLRDFVVYPSHYFDASPVKKDSVAIHLALGSWREVKSKDPTYNLGYKIRWRVEAFFQLIAKKWGYKLIKLQ